jgi:hypothetical protein
MYQAYADQSPSCVNQVVSTVSNNTSRRSFSWDSSMDNLIPQTPTKFAKGAFCFWTYNMDQSESVAAICSSAPSNKTLKNVKGRTFLLSPKDLNSIMRC